MGFPFEHGLHATLTAMRLVDLLGVDSGHRRSDVLRVLPMYRRVAAERFGWPLRVIDDAGHAFFWDQPQAFVEAVDTLMG